MTWKIAIVALFCMTIAAFAVQSEPLAPANLKFSNVGGAVGLSPFAIGNNSIVGIFCCLPSADPYSSLNTAGFLLNPPGYFPQFMVTLPPGWTSGFASGIDARGTLIVGGYCTKNDCASYVSEHGFLLQLDYGDEYFPFSTTDFPGALATIASGVNSSGVIVGTYCLQSNTCYFQAPDHGFKNEKGTFTEIKFPGSASTGVFGINDTGDMVGSYSLSSVPSGLPSSGAVLNFTGRTPPKANTPPEIGKNGIPVYGWLFSGGAFTAINPAGATVTIPAAINNSGVVVGTFIDAHNQSHGFMYSNGKFLQIDHPNATSTTAYGIDDKNEIVGTYIAPDGLSYGYIAK
jgi:probable HAF family extracellular repeat protein